MQRTFTARTFSINIIQNTSPASTCQQQQYRRLRDPHNLIQQITSRPTTIGTEDSGKRSAAFYNRRYRLRRAPDRCAHRFNKLYNSNFNGAMEDMGMISLQALNLRRQAVQYHDHQQLHRQRSKALLATNVTNLVFMGNTCTSLDDGSSGPVRFEGNTNTADIQYNTVFNNSGPAVAIDSSGVPGDSRGSCQQQRPLPERRDRRHRRCKCLRRLAHHRRRLGGVARAVPAGLGPGTGPTGLGNGNLGHGGWRPRG